MNEQRREHHHLSYRRIFYHFAFALGLSALGTVMEQTTYANDTEACTFYIRKFDITLEGYTEYLQILRGDRKLLQEDEVNLNKLAEELASSLEREFLAKGIRAQRHLSSELLPNTGYLVSGKIKIRTGNRLSRALIGYGHGATELSVEPALTNLAMSGRGMSSEQKRVGSSGYLPGAVISKNPYFFAFKLARERTTIKRLIDGLTSAMVEDYLTEHKSCRAAS